MSDAQPTAAAVDQTTRDRIATAMHSELTDLPVEIRRQAGLIIPPFADAVLAVLPPPADRSAVLREAADAVQQHGCLCRDRLRRLAAEAQQPAVGARQPDTETPVVRHAPGKAILCPDCSAKGRAVCMDAERPRCPHCQMPHDLSPGSSAVLACASIRASIADRDAASAVPGRSAADTEARVAPHCDGFPTTCPNPVTVPPAPPHHGGGIRCGCYDEEA